MPRLPQHHQTGILDLPPERQNEFALLPFCARCYYLLPVTVRYDILTGSPTLAIAILCLATSR